MIVCSCNRLSDAEIRGCCRNGGPDAPRHVGQVYRCLGCSPQCGRCARTIGAILKEAQAVADCVCTGSCHCPNAELQAAA